MPCINSQWDIISCGEALSSTGQGPQRALSVLLDDAPAMPNVPSGFNDHEKDRNIHQTIIYGEMFMTGAMVYWIVVQN